MAEYILGIDVSRYQGNIDWKTVAASGEIRFAVIRSSIGSIYKDPTFVQNWNGAKEAGLLVAPYHVIRWDAEPAKQAKNLFDVMKLVPGQPDLPIVLDVELPTPAGGDGTHVRAVLNTGQVAQKIRDEHFQISGVDPTMVYTGAWWWVPAWKAYVKAGYKGANIPFWLWTAAYITVEPKPYEPWRSWDVWQYTSTGRVAGIIGNVDTNRVTVDSAFYNRFFSQVPIPPEPPEPEPSDQIIVVNTDKPVKIFINGSEV